MTEVRIVKMNSAAVVIVASMIGQLVVPASAQSDRSNWKPIAFKRHRLNANAEFSACAVFDVDNDGNLDIYSGGFWYAAPDWQRHVTREVPNIRGRYDDYSNLPLDVNNDGWTDVISVNYRSRSIYWIENPGAVGRRWPTHLIDSPGSSETGLLVDVNGDGRVDILPNGTKFAAWYEVQNASGAKPDSANDREDDTPVSWIRHELPASVIGHGIGAGDIDQDGRMDLVTPRGWFRAVDDQGERWHHQAEFRLHSDGSIPILVQDVDQDGDLDVIWGRGHGIGLYWLEQGADDNGRTWSKHVIDTSWSSAHAILWADLDANGVGELVAGKRYLGHGGKDPGEWDPLVVYRYEFDPKRRVWRQQQISFGGVCGFDLDPDCADLDQDGDLDLVAPTRAGLCWLENLLNEGNEPTDQRTRWEYAADEPILLYRNQTGATSQISKPTGWGYRRRAILQNMQKVMGALPSASSRVPLETKVSEQVQADGYRRLKLSFAADATHRVPAYLLLPDDLGESAAAMLCLHPTHALGKAQICGLGGKPSRFYAHELAQRGYVCLTPDYPSFGDDEEDFSGSTYVSGTMRAIWDNVRAIDLLESWPGVNGDKIGCIGHSLGGHNGLFTAAFDQRIRVIVTSCGFTAFAAYYDGDLRGWTSPRYMPRIIHQYALAPERMPFDFHEVLGALAPRPLFISAPIGDSNFDVRGVRRSVARATPVYEMFDAASSLRVEYPECGHDFPEEVRQTVYDWLDHQFD